MLSPSELIVVVLAVGMLVAMGLSALAGVIARLRRGRVEEPPPPPRRRGIRGRGPGRGRV